jgi:hypothetical protein
MINDLLAAKGLLWGEKSHACCFTATGWCWRWSLQGGDCNRPVSNNLSAFRFTPSGRLLSRRLGNKTDEGHDGNDEAEPHIEDRKPVQVLVA